jgi:hypothetical protein
MKDSGQLFVFLFPWHNTVLLKYIILYHGWAAISHGVAFFLLVIKGFDTSTNWKRVAATRKPLEEDEPCEQSLHPLSCYDPSLLTFPPLFLMISWCCTVVWIFLTFFERFGGWWIRFPAFMAIWLESSCFLFQNFHAPATASICGPFPLSLQRFTVKGTTFFSVNYFVSLNTQSM